MQQENDADDRNDDALLDERRLQRFDSAVNELGTVVDGNNFGAGRQARLDFGKPGLDVVDDGERVLPVALHGDTGNHFALAVEFGNAAPLIGRQLDAGDVANIDWSAALAFQDDLLDILDVADVAATPHHELGLGQLHDPPADVHVGSADSLSEF